MRKPTPALAHASSCKIIFPPANHKIPAHRDSVLFFLLSAAQRTSVPGNIKEQLLARNARTLETKSHSTQNIFAAHEQGVLLF